MAEYSLRLPDGRTVRRTLGEGLSNADVQAAFMPDYRSAGFRIPGDVIRLQGSISNYTPTLGERIQGVMEPLLGRNMAQRASNFFNDLTPLGNATMAADAGTDIHNGHWLRGAGLGALAVLPGAAGKVGKGMFGRAGGDAFRRWFNGSRVVDRTGSPLRLFHGTKADFDAFDMSKFGSGDDGLLGKGFYFSYNPEEASSYAERAMYGVGDSPNVIPAYLSLKKPLVVKQGILPDGRRVTDVHGGGINAKGSAEIRSMADAAGHDGVIWTNNDGDVLHAVAFEPQQIKSAIGNAGTFDPRDPRLTH